MVDVYFVFYSSIWILEKAPTISHYMFWLTLWRGIFEWSARNQWITLSTLRYFTYFSFVILFLKYFNKICSILFKHNQANHHDVYAALKDMGMSCHTLQNLISFTGFTLFFLNNNSNTNQSRFRGMTSLKFLSTRVKFSAYRKYPTLMKILPITFILGCLPFQRLVKKTLKSSELESKKRKRQDNIN